MLEISSGACGSVMVGSGSRSRCRSPQSGWGWRGSSRAVPVLPHCWRRRRDRTWRANRSGGCKDDRYRPPGVAQSRIRNGADPASARVGMRPGHAHLAVDAAITWCQLMLNTLADPGAPWRHRSSEYAPLLLQHASFGLGEFRIGKPRRGRCRFAPEGTAATRGVPAAAMGRRTASRGPALEEHV